MKIDFAGIKLDLGKVKNNTKLLILFVIVLLLLITFILTVAKPYYKQKLEEKQIELEFKKYVISSLHEFKKEIKVISKNQVTEKMIIKIFNSEMNKNNKELLTCFNKKFTILLKYQGKTSNEILKQLIDKELPINYMWGVTNPYEVPIEVTDNISKYPKLINDKVQIKQIDTTLVYRSEDIMYGMMREFLNNDSIMKTIPEELNKNKRKNRRKK